MLNHESDSGDETRHSYKDARRFPLAAPSRAPVFPSYGLSMPIRNYGCGFSYHA